MTKYTTKGAYFYEDFDTGLEFLEKPLLIWTQSWNKRFGLGRGEYIAFIAKKGTNNDGASIPKFIRPLLWVCPRDKTIKLPAVGHDYLYAEQDVELFVYNKAKGKIVKNLGVQHISQREADIFIRDKMKAMGANLYDRQMVHAGLYVGGGFSYREHTARILKNKKH